MGPGKWTDMDEIPAITRTLGSLPEHNVADCTQTHKSNERVILIPKRHITNISVLGKSLSQEGD